MRVSHRNIILIILTWRRDHRSTVMYQHTSHTDLEPYRPTHPPLTVRGLVGLLAAYLGLLAALSLNPVLALAALGCLLAAAR